MKVFVLHYESKSDGTIENGILNVYADKNMAIAELQRQRQKEIDLFNDTFGEDETDVEIVTDTHTLFQIQWNEWDEYAEWKISENELIEK